MPKAMRDRAKRRCRILYASVETTHTKSGAARLHSANNGLPVPDVAAPRSPFRTTFSM